MRRREIHCKLATVEATAEVWVWISSGPSSHRRQQSIRLVLTVGVIGVYSTFQVHFQSLHNDLHYRCSRNLLSSRERIMVLMPAAVTSPLYRFGNSLLTPPPSPYGSNTYIFVVKLPWKCQPTVGNHATCFHPYLLGILYYHAIQLTDKEQKRGSPSKRKECQWIKAPTKPCPVKQQASRHLASMSVGETLSPGNIFQKPVCNESRHS